MALPNSTGSKNVPVECEECDGGVVERVVGEDRGGMGGISPVTRDEPCEECEDGLLGCTQCGETPSFNSPELGERLCLDCLQESLADLLEESA